MNIIRMLLNMAIDYAGLFPPANLGMDAAVRNYAEYRAGSSSWALGRFVVPASRLPEFRDCVNALKTRPHEPWRLSVLGGTDLNANLQTMNDLQIRSTEALIDAVELKLGNAEEMDRILRVFPNHPVYLEIPIGMDPCDLIEAIARRNARAKVRTGGVTGDLFPSPAQLARFLVRCAELRVAFKATAGLHHALRSIHPLTYEASSPSATMHGFLNVLVASAAAYNGNDEQTVRQILQEESIHEFVFDAAGMGFRELAFPGNQVIGMREHFFVSFGSCSFLEPLSELKVLGLL